MVISEHENYIKIGRISGPENYQPGLGSVVSWREHVRSRSCDRCVAAPVSRKALCLFLP